MKKLLILLSCLSTSAFALMEINTLNATSGYVYAAGEQVVNNELADTLWVYNTDSQVWTDSRLKTPANGIQVSALDPLGDWYGCDNLGQVFSYTGQINSLGSINAQATSIVYDVNQLFVGDANGVLWRCGVESACTKDAQSPDFASITGMVSVNNTLLIGTAVGNVFKYNGNGFVNLHFPAIEPIKSMVVDSNKNIYCQTTEGVIEEYTSAGSWILLGQFYSSQLSSLTIDLGNNLYFSGVMNPAGGVLTYQQANGFWSMIPDSEALQLGPVAANSNTDIYMMQMNVSYFYHYDGTIWSQLPLPQ